MSSLNRTTLIGRLGADPRIVTFPDGSKCANFSLATSMKWKDAQGALKEETEWHYIVVYGKVADIVEQYVRKGDLLFVEGRGRTRKYNDGNGVEKSVHETVVAGFEGQVKLFPKTQQQPTPAAQPEWCKTAGDRVFNWSGLPPGDIQPVETQQTLNTAQQDEPQKDDLPF